MNIDKDRVNKIIEFLTKNIKPNLIYLFGSGVNGIFREDSDIDIAFISNVYNTDYAVLNEEREVILKSIKKRGHIYE